MLDLLDLVYVSGLTLNNVLPNKDIIAGGGSNVNHPVPYETLLPS